MISQRLAEIRKIYSDAEYAIKRYERIALEDQVAAINELRYAGRHILEASQTDDEVTIEDHIASARNHCRRAVNDAKDAAIVSQLEFFAQFGDCRFTGTELEKVLPDWKEAFVEIASWQKKFADAGMAKDISYGDELDTGILRLMELREKFSSVLPVLNENRFQEEFAEKSEEKSHAEAVKRQEQQERDAAKTTEHRHFVISIVVAVVLAIIGIAVSIAIS